VKVSVREGTLMKTLSAITTVVLSFTGRLKPPAAGYECRLRGLN
jgi:hypothetical protein